jgi:hypothetical protein
MYKVTTTFERPSTDIQFFLTSNQELRAAFAEFIADIPELLLLNVIDETPLKQTAEAFYPDEASFDAFTAKFNERFPSFFADRDAYHQSVGVVTSRVAESV